MLITVTTANQKLSDILTKTQWEKLINSITKIDWNFKLVFQILWASNVYLDIWQESTVADWLKLTTNGTVSILVNAIEKINLIAESSSNTNVRVIWA